MAVPVRRPTPRSATPSEPITGATPVGGWWIADFVFAALRVVAALMLMQHGLQKHFGLLLAPGQPFPGSPPLFTQMGISGTLELVGGLLLAIGLFTRPVAFVLSGLMAFAYFLVHFKRGYWPILNGGELAILNCFVFLVFAVIGPGVFSVDALIGRRRTRSYDSRMTVNMSPWIKRQYRRRELTR